MSLRNRTQAVALLERYKKGEITKQEYEDFLENCNTNDITKRMLEKYKKGEITKQEYEDFLENHYNYYITKIMPEIQRDTFNTLPDVKSYTDSAPKKAKKNFVSIIRLKGEKLLSGLLGLYILWSIAGGVESIAYFVFHREGYGILGLVLFCFALLNFPLLLKDKRSIEKSKDNIHDTIEKLSIEGEVSPTAAEEILRAVSELTKYKN